MNDSIGCNSSTCPTIGSQSATVCLPVSISPYAVTGPACVKCRGSAVINHTCMDCKGIVNGKCDFVISQKIQIDLPVEFGATVKVGDTYVDCDCSPCRDACVYNGNPEPYPDLFCMNNHSPVRSHLRCKAPGFRTA